MPDKIVIPPERPCPYCDGKGYIIELEGEKCLNCHGTGRAWVFDELAAAVDEAGFEIEQPFKIASNEWEISISDCWYKHSGTGPAPTAALVAAAENANEGG